jgi:uncharacterized delta-60 repeat protein
MSVESRLRPSGRTNCARRRAAKRDLPGIGTRAASRGGNPFESLEGRRLLSVTVALGGATAASEGDYTLGLSTGGSSGAAISTYTINWGDGTTETAPTSPTRTHEYDGLSAPTPYTLTATARGQVVTSTIADRSGTVQDVIVQPDGKTITVGSISFPTISGMEVRRYNVDGTPDVTFGIGGRTVINDPLINSSYFGRAGAIELTGGNLSGIIVVGVAQVGAHDEFAVARLNPNGTQDLVFGGGDGLATARFSTGTFDDASANDVAVQPDGRIIVVGSANVGSSVNADFAVARFNANGSLDSSFSGDGLETTSLGTDDSARGVALRFDGSGHLDGIIAAGVSDLRVALATYALNSAGELGAVQTRVETTFGTAHDVTFANGQVYVTGVVDSPTGDLGLFRYNPDGSPSAGFVNGRATFGIRPTSPTGARFSPGLVSGIVVQPDGKVLVGDTLVNPVFTIPPQPDDGKAGFGLHRFNADGSIDTGFGLNGVVFTETDRNGLSGGGIASLPGGGIVQAGTVHDAVNGGSDTDGAVLFYGNASLTVTVSNVAPALDPIERLMIGGPPEAPEFVPYVGDGSMTAYETLVFQFGVDDVSAPDRDAGITMSFDWGDGTDIESGIVPAPFSFPGGHAYTHAGTYTITVTGDDKDGGHSVVTKTIVVSRAAVQPDPVNGGNMLVVAGLNTSPAGNKIQIKSAAGGIQAVVDGFTSAVFANVNRVVIYGNEGDDDIQVLAPVKAEIYGGAGNDKIKGNTGNDILIGEEGDDLITGGAGRDLLVGGEASDKLIGDSEDDILIGGIYTDVTFVDVRRFAASAIMAEWCSANSYAVRVDNLRFGTGANNGVVLAGYDTASQNGGFQTILDDQAQDKLTGNTGQDWFFANVDGPVADKITDLLSSEFTDADRAFVA